MSSIWKCTLGACIFLVVYESEIPERAAKGGLDRLGETLQNVDVTFCSSVSLCHSAGVPRRSPATSHSLGSTLDWIPENNGPFFFPTRAVEFTSAQ